MNFKFVMGAVGLGACLGLSGMYQMHKNANFTKVDATITSAKSRCYVIPKKNAYERKRDRYRNRIHNLRCSDLRQRANFRRRYRKRYLVSYKFDYISPVDGSMQSGTYKRDRLRELKKQRVGGVLSIHAHNRNPSKYVF